MKYLFSLILVLGMLVGTSSATTLTGSPQFFGSPVPNGSLEFLRKNCGVEQTFTFVLNGTGLASGSLTGTDAMTGCQGTPYYKITLRNASGQLLWIKNAVVTGGSWSTVGFTELSPLPPDVAFSNNAGVAGVSQFAGRSGIVTPFIGDYLASQVTNAFDISAYNDLTTIATPGANPSAGKVRLYAKTSIGRLCVLNSSGQESCGVNPTSAIPHQWLNAVLADGTFTQSRPDFTDLSGTTAVVLTNQANTFGSFLQKFKAGSNFQLTDSTDATKILQFDLSNIASGQTRTVNIPNANSTTVQSSTAAANQFATAISAQGVVTYTQPSFLNISGSVTDAQVPDNITINLAATATALAANPANCSAGSVPNGIDAGGVVETCNPLPVNTTATATQFFTAYNFATGAFTKAQPAFTDISGSVTDAQVPDNITVTLSATATALAANGANCTGAKLPNGVDTLGAAENCTFALPGEFVVDGVTYTTIQQAVTAAGSTGSVRIPPGYAGSDVYTNTNGIQITDQRRVNSSPSRQRGFINMLTDCGLKGDGTTDDAPAAQACFTAYPGNSFFFPQTASSGACSYWFASTVFPKGEGAKVSGASSGFKNSNTSQGGTVICSAAGVTPLWLDMTPNSSSGITIENLSLKGSEGTDHLSNPNKLNIPSGANLPQFTRNIATIQRTANVLTVTTSQKGLEGLTQSVGSTVLISGVVGDSTMNGRCIIATLTGTNTYGENATGFTCPQNGADAGPFGAVGTVSLPTTGASTADGIRVCSNFNTVRNVSIDAFGRHGVNADMQAGHGCTTLFADDLLLENVTMMGNQGNGFYAQGIDSNAGTMISNPIYYNLLWGVEDQSALGNNWFGNQISPNGSQWAVTTTPSTKAISTISRTLTSGVSQVSVVLSVVDTNIKLGSCVFIAGVTDATFNTTAGQCFFVNSYTDSTHFGYEQPGAPANASSSGGTSRMAKFSEAYLSAGVDSGAVKVATQTQTYAQPWVGNYVEGGQVCKFGSVVSIGGANMPDCAALNTWRNAVTIRPVTAGTVGSSSNIHGFANEVDQNNNLNLKAGISGSTVRDTVFQWYNNNDSSLAWQLDVDPSGHLGINGQWVLRSPNAISRIAVRGTSLANGNTLINGETTGGVEFNNCNNCGSGGVKFGSGGAVNTTVGTIDNTGLATLNGGYIGPFFKSSTTNPASAGFLRLAKTDAVNFRNNANGADLNGVSLRSSDVLQLGDSAGAAVGTSTVAGTMILDGPAGSLRSLSFTTAGVNRWFARANSTAEGGSNAGSDLEFVSRDDSGVLLATVLTLKRSNSLATFAGSVLAPAFSSTTANPATTGQVRLAKTDTVLFRNNANSADLNALSLRSNDILQLGDAAGAVVGTSTNAGAFAIDGPAASNRSLVFNTTGVNRWILRASTAAESGGNVGSDLQLSARDDSGALLSTPITVRRSDGLMTLATGINSPFFSTTTTNPASAGQVRLAKTDCLNFRNNAASADVAGICLNGADQVTLGGTAGVAPSSIPAAAIAAVDNSIISAAVDGTGSPVHITTAVSTALLPINGGTTNLSLYIAGKPMVLSSNVTVTLTTGVNYIYALGDISTPANGSYTLSSSDFVVSLIPMSYSYVAPSCSNGANTSNGVGGFFTAASAGNPHYWFNMTTNQMNICTSSGGSFTATSYGGANAPAILIGKAYYDGTSILAVGPMPTGASPKNIVRDLGTGADGALSITAGGTTTKDGLFYVTTLDVITGTLTHTAGNVNAQTTGLAFYSQNPIIVYNGTVSANSKGRGAAGSGSTGAGPGGSSGGFGGAGGGGGGSATAAGGLGGQHQTPLFPSLGNNGGAGGVIGSNGSNGGSALSGMVNLSLFATYQPFCSGASGGGGAGDGTNNGGLSNVGGGYILLRGATVTLGGSALLDANGGNGLTGTAGNAAGGAGAGGGCAFIAGGATYGGVLDTNITVNGGTGGVHFGAGTGKDGGNGGKGLNGIFRIW